MSYHCSHKRCTRILNDDEHSHCGVCTAIELHVDENDWSTCPGCGTDFNDDA